MAKVIIQPAGGRESREHYAATIQRPVSLDQIRRFLPTVEMSALEEAYGRDSVPTWGVTPSDRRAGRNVWDQMQPGDIVLFTGGKKVYAGGIIIYRAHNAALARELWGTAAFPRRSTECRWTTKRPCLRPNRIQPRLSATLINAAAATLGNAMKNGTENGARTILNRSDRDIGMSPFGGIGGPVPLSEQGKAIINLKRRSDQRVT